MHQPIHTVYGGAHLFKSTTCSKLGALAQKAFAKYAPDAAALVQVFGIPDALAETVHLRVAEKLRREAVEDFRIDFEDGFGVRSDAEEDAAADNAAREVTGAVQAKSLPKMFGIRVKSFHTRTAKARALRTLDRFLSHATLPANSVVTLPKITAPEQVSELVEALRLYPEVRIEIMVETPASIFILPRLLEAAGGKCIAAHFGAYDYQASLGITAAPELHHPACEFARSMMLATLAETGVWLVDGATNLLPFPPEVHRAWKLHYDNIRHSLYNGFYQGWDLHPAQIPARLIAVHSYFLEGLAEASARLRNFRDQSEQATRVGAIFDDAATGRGLVNFFERAVRCGAI